MDQDLVERIYESAFVPELWPGVLDALARIADGDGGALYITKAEVHYWTSSSGIRDRAESFVNDHWLWRGELIARAFALRHAGFLTELDLVTLEELDQEPIYRDFFRPRGIGWIVGTAIPIPTGENVLITTPRRIERGPVERTIVQTLDELRPHLARGVLLSARLQLERARVAGITLAALGIPALVLDEHGKVLAANTLMEALGGTVHWLAQDRVALMDKAADRLLRDAITAIDETGATVRSFPVRDAANESMMVAHVIPIRLSARDIFVRCAAVLVLTPVAQPQAPPVELVQSLFDLTPAEARVARGLASGRTVENIATDGDVAPSTIRTHVKHVLEKTGCNRQVEVVTLLNAISSARLTQPT
jgi:DNA-binding CsgD family transcriptional regulator